LADADFSPDGKQIASTGDGNVVKLWDLASGKLPQSLSGHAA
jgi:WD40 repeat protein